MECDKDIAHKLMASKEGAYETIIKCILQYEENDIVLLATLKCIVTLMEGQPDLLQIKDISIFNRYFYEKDSNRLIYNLDHFLSPYSYIADY